MKHNRTFLAFGMMLMVALVLSTSTPASANPTGTTFLFQAQNFQGDDAGEVIPFGVPTPTASGMILDSQVTPLPNGHDFLDITFNTANGGYLASNAGGQSIWLIDGINWGAYSPAVAVGLLYISFDHDGQYLALNPNNALGFYILPDPQTGADAVVVDVDGNPATTIPFDVGTSLGIILGQILVNHTTADILSVNSMHIGFEVAHIPEPASAMLVLSGLAGLCVVRRRRV